MTKYSGKYTETENGRYEYIEPNMNGVPIKISVMDEPGNMPEGQIMSRLHMHDEIEIITVRMGKIEFVLADGSKHGVSAGQTVCVDTRVLHSTNCLKSPYLSSMIQFRADLFEDSGEKENSYEKYLSRLAVINEKHIIITDDEKVYECMMNIGSEYKTRKSGYDLYVTSYMYYILGYLHRNGFLSDKLKINRAKLKRLKPILEYISNHYNTDIKLAEMSEILGISEYHFCRLWKSIIGASFVDYLNFVRVSKAEKLLRNTEDNILEIALDTGFSSLSYFNRVFRKFRKCSPTVYRKASKEKYPK